MALDALYLFYSAYQAIKNQWGQNEPLEWSIFVFWKTRLSNNLSMVKLIKNFLFRLKTKILSQQKNSTSVFFVKLCEKLSAIIQ